MRLIDANNFGVGKANPDVFDRKDYAYGWNNALQAVTEAAPTIDPETMPIVQQLREELKQERKICDDLQRNLVQVAKERDAAVSFIPKTCATCKYGESPCDWCVNDPDGDMNWEWNGKAEEDCND